MKSFVPLVLLALILVTVALVSALTAMRLAIHGREVSVPKLVGLAPAEAERTVSALGLQIVVERQYYSPNIAEGKIMSQLPEADTRVRRGWQVRVAQSLGPQRVEIPDVVGESEHAAELNISRRGLDVGAIAQIDMLGTPVNQVISQSHAQLCWTAVGERNSGFAGCRIAARLGYRHRWHGSERSYNTGHRAHAGRAFGFTG